MNYNIGNYRKIIGDYFFETDEFYTIHVYKNENLEYFDTIQTGYKYDYDEFITLCNEWLDNKNKNII